MFKLVTQLLNTFSSRNQNTISEMPARGLKLLVKADSDYQNDESLLTEEDRSSYDLLKYRHKLPKWTIYLLLISLFINIEFGVMIWKYRRPPVLDTLPRSKYAGLQRTNIEPYVLQTKFSSENDTLQTQLWHDINVNYGVVALSDEWAAAHGLRIAQRFPWDTSKGIYILHGFHNLHCLKIIHISIDEYRHGEQQSNSWHHISHCLDGLRRQILCDADDTPRATERRAEVVSGVGQHRRCRSWKALEEWAKKHNACYKRPERDDGKPTIEQFKHCPPGSPYVVTDDYVPTDEFLVGLPEESIEMD